MKEILISIVISALVAGLIVTLNNYGKWPLKPAAAGAAG